MAAKGQRARAVRAINSKRRRRIRAELLDKAGYRCQAEGCEATTSLTIDHIIPWCEGGTNDIENLQILCFPCNQAKAVEEEMRLRIQRLKAKFND